MLENHSKSCSKTIFSLKSDAPSRTKGDSTWDKRMASRIHHGSLWMPCPYPQKHHGLHGQKMTIVWVWVKQQIINHAWLGMVNISPTKMMIWGMVYDIVLPTLHVAFAIWKKSSGASRRPRIWQVFLRLGTLLGRWVEHESLRKGICHDVVEIPLVAAIPNTLIICTDMYWRLL